jgi:hypothetical protein
LAHRSPRRPGPWDRAADRYQPESSAAQHRVPQNVSPLVPDASRVRCGDGRQPKPDGPSRTVRLRKPLVDPATSAAGTSGTVERCSARYCTRAQPATSHRLDRSRPLARVLSHHVSQRRALASAADDQSRLARPLEPGPKGGPPLSAKAAQANADRINVSTSAHTEGRGATCRPTPPSSIPPTAFCSWSTTKRTAAGGQRSQHPRTADECRGGSTAEVLRVGAFSAHRLGARHFRWRGRNDEQPESDASN